MVKKIFLIENRINKTSIFKKTHYLQLSRKQLSHLNPKIIKQLYAEQHNLDLSNDSENFNIN